MITNADDGLDETQQSAKIVNIPTQVIYSSHHQWLLVNVPKWMTFGAPEKDVGVGWSELIDNFNKEFGIKLGGSSHVIVDGDFSKCVEECSPAYNGERANPIYLAGLPIFSWTTTWNLSRVEILPSVLNNGDGAVFYIGNPESRFKFNAVALEAAFQMASGNSLKIHVSIMLFDLAYGFGDEFITKYVELVRTYTERHFKRLYKVLKMI